MWKKYDFFGAAVGTLVLVYALVIDSSMYLEPISISYDVETERVTYTRDVHFTHKGYYATEIIIPEDYSFQCKDSGQGFYNAKEEPFVASWNVAPALKPCYEQTDKTRIVINYHTAYLFGVIPLRPAELVQVLPGDVKEGSRRN